MLLAHRLVLTPWEVAWAATERQDISDIGTSSAVGGAMRIALATTLQPKRTYGDMDSAALPLAIEENKLPFLKDVLTDDVVRKLFDRAAPDCRLTFVQLASHLRQSGISMDNPAVRLHLLQIVKRLCICRPLGDAESPGLARQPVKYLFLRDPSRPPSSPPPSSPTPTPTPPPLPLPQLDDVLATARAWPTLIKIAELVRNKAPVCPMCTEEVHQPAAAVGCGHLVCRKCQTEYAAKAQDPTKARYECCQCRTPAKTPPVVVREMGALCAAFHQVMKELRKVLGPGHPALGDDVQSLSDRRMDQMLTQEARKRRVKAVAEEPIVTSRLRSNKRKSWEGVEYTPYRPQRKRQRRQSPSSSSSSSVAPPAPPAPPAPAPPVPPAFIVTPRPVVYGVPTQNTILAPQPQRLAPQSQRLAAPALPSPCLPGPPAFSFMPPQVLSSPSCSYSGMCGGGCDECEYFRYSLWQSS